MCCRVARFFSSGAGAVMVGLRQVALSAQMAISCRRRNRCRAIASVRGYIRDSGNFEILAEGTGCLERKIER